MTTGSIATTDDIELHYEERGEGDRVLVVPSLSWLARDMDELAPGYRVVFYDIRGRGRSSAILDDAHLALEKDIVDLEHLRDALSLERFSLLGWSYHGALAARYALRHVERVESLIMVGPTAPKENPYWMDFLENFGQRCRIEWLREVDTARKSSMRDTDPVGWCKLVHSVFFRCYVKDQEVLDRMRSCPCAEPNLDADRVNDQGRRLLEKLGDYDWTAEYGSFGTPTLLVHGIEDPVPLAGTEAWHAILSNSSLEVLDDSGHMPWLDAPERFFPIVNGFLGCR